MLIFLLEEYIYIILFGEVIDPYFFNYGNGLKVIRKKYKFKLIKYILRVNGSQWYYNMVQFDKIKEDDSF